MCVGQVAEPLGERHGEEEREENLHTGKRDAELVEQLDQLAVTALLGILSFLGAAGSLCHREPRLRRWFDMCTASRGGPKPSAGGDRPSPYWRARASCRPPPRRGGGRAADAA